MVGGISNTRRRTHSYSLMRLSSSDSKQTAYSYCIYKFALHCRTIAARQPPHIVCLSKHGLRWLAASTYIHPFGLHGPLPSNTRAELVHRHTRSLARSTPHKPNIMQFCIKHTNIFIKLAQNMQCVCICASVFSHQ